MGQVREGLRSLVISYGTVHLFVILSIGAIQDACLFVFKDVGDCCVVTESLFVSKSVRPLPSTQGDIHAIMAATFLGTAHMRGHSR